MEQFWIDSKQKCEIMNDLKESLNLNDWVRFLVIYRNEQREFEWCPLRSTIVRSVKNEIWYRVLQRES